MDDRIAKLNNRLKIDLNRFDFVGREMVDGHMVKNRCGRDFLYYVLHFLYPDEYNFTKNNPVALERNHTLGYPVEATYVWTGLSLMNVPKLLKTLKKRLLINTVNTSSFPKLIKALWWPKRITYKEGVNIMEEEIRNGNPVGIDIGVAAKGLMDHVMFAYGFDEESIYVFDTHKVPQLSYQKITADDRFIMCLPRTTVENGWTRFARIWVVKT